MARDRLILSGADLVLPDRVLRGSLILDGEFIVDLVPGAVAASTTGRWVDLSGHLVVPGFVDVHVHGLEGIDTLDDTASIGALAARMPRYGVTAFCPTTVACQPDALRRVLAAVRDERLVQRPGSARVLPAHLESNFISPAYKGAQPATCLRSGAHGHPHHEAAPPSGDTAFSGADILAVIESAGADVAIVTIAPEIDGGLDLIQRLCADGRIVSLGHSGATYEQGVAAIAAGARQATHLFNRMPPVGHREPGLAGAILQADDVTAELVCDGFHVHPGMIRIAIAAKGVDRVMAITDGSAGAALPVGARTRLGGRAITVTEHAAFLDDGTLAGSTATMDRVFRVLTGDVGVGLVEAARLCATTPAREMGLQGRGVIAPGAFADLVVLDRQRSVVETLVAGRCCLGRI